MKSPYSNQVREFTIEPGCPWYEAQQSYGAPNVNWCEPTQCTIINEPANTWSNLAYILVALVLIRKLRDANIRMFPYAVILMGLASGIYHASNNYLTQYLDFVGMFLMMSFLLAFNINRLLKNLNLGFSSIFWFFMFVNSTAFMVFDIVDSPVQKMILFNAIPIIIFDLLAGWNEGILNRYKYFVLSILFLGIAQTCAIMDIKRIYCEPGNLWLHGHVLWHLIGSLGMLFIGLHMKKVVDSNRMFSS